MPCVSGVTSDQKLSACRAARSSLDFKFVFLKKSSDNL